MRKGQQIEWFSGRMKKLNKVYPRMRYRNPNVLTKWHKTRNGLYEFIRCYSSRLLFAVEGQKQLLALVDTIGVLDLGVGLQDAAPGCGPAILRLGDLR